MKKINCFSIYLALKRWLQRIRSIGNIQQAIRFIYSNGQMYIDPTGIAISGKSDINQTDIGCDILVDTLRIGLENLTQIDQFLNYCDDNKEQDYLKLTESWKNIVKCI